MDGTLTKSNSTTLLWQNDVESLRCRWDESRGLFAVERKYIDPESFLEGEHPGWDDWRYIIGSSQAETAMQIYEVRVKETVDRHQALQDAIAIAKKYGFEDWPGYRRNLQAHHNMVFRTDPAACENAYIRHVNERIKWRARGNPGVAMQADLGRKLMGE